MNIFLAYFATIIPLVLLDALWILVIAKKFYAEQMGFLFNTNINLMPIVIFYPLYTLGIVFLVVMPATISGTWVEAFWRGALLGLVAYGAYDLTNHATILNWPLLMTIVDMFWGVLVTATASTIAYFIIMNFK